MKVGRSGMPWQKVTKAVKYLQGHPPTIIAAVTMKPRLKISPASQQVRLAFGNFREPLQSFSDAGVQRPGTPDYKSLSALCWLY
jgi:hypothetical protein